MDYNEKIALQDDILLRVAEKSEKIEDILDAFFGFLQRKTDFFHVMKNQDEKMGFPSGAAEKMVQDTFMRHRSLYEQRWNATDRSDRNSAVEATASSTTRSEKREADLSLEPTGHPHSEPNPHSEGTAGTSSERKGAATSNGSSSKTLEKNKHISTWNGGITDKYRYGPH
eukprot:GHVU01209348.1.p2 GENE.GHVU01209348.1~~GHVU01209348.1.p2  ORF type:complete len:170 (-),score=28.08 GHVU01209348.1:3066-3575(-)